MCRRSLACVAVLVFTSALLGAQDKPIITVLDLKTEGISLGEMRSAVSLLSSGLFRTGTYTVIDVTERDRLLSEVEFSVSDCTDQRCQLEIGKMLSAQYVVVGNLGLVGKKCVISVKMLQTETARTVGTGDGVYASMDALIENVDALVAQLTGGKARAARAPLSGQTAGGLVALGVGVVGGGVGGVLVALAANARGGSVQDAYQSYLGLAPGTEQSTIDAAWAAYQQRFSGYRTKLIVGISAGGAGVALLGISGVLFLVPQRTAATSGARVGVLPAEGLRGVVVRVSY